jgi:hypothetical protein
MPKAILEYDLYEWEDRQYHNYACSALNVRLAVGAFDEELRRMIKDWDDDEPPAMDISDIRMLLLQHFEDHDVDWETF